ncbi:type IV pilus biogenesis protein PilM [Escherichia coli]
MKYTPVLILFALFSYAILFNLNDDINRASVESINNETVAFNFLSATKAFDDYYSVHPEVSGDVTELVDYQSWLPVNKSVKMVVANGVGYVYSPATVGVYSLLLEKTGGSSFLGFSDSAWIKTPSGKISKPSFIGTDYIVYMR